MDILSQLNPDQREAVTTIDGPLLLLAGAGSGKTRVLVNRIAYMVHGGVRPFNILAITFTNKAAREMKERIGRLLGEAGEVWASTFHSMCVRILRRDIDKLGYDGKFTIYDTEDSQKIMKQVLKELNVNDKLFPAQGVLGVIGRKKDGLIGPEAYLKEAGNDFRERQMAELYAAYQKRLRANNALDFDDLIFLTVKLFHTQPDVLEKYQNRFLYISVDEYQDTNFAQYQLVKMLSDKHMNICVVGDDDQSIYGWRGADIRNILEFEKDFPGARVLRLEQNYRSTKTILDAANAVISHNRRRKGKTLWTENQAGAWVTYFNAESDFEEAAYVVSQIKDRADKGAGYKDFAVLYRMNAQSRLFEDRLVRENVPYRVVGGVRFYERREVKDVLAYLRTINNPLDDISLRRILNVPRRGIGGGTEAKISGYAVEMEVPFYDALSSFGEISGLPYNGKRVGEFVRLMNGLADFAANRPVGEVVREVLKQTDYVNELLVTEHDRDAAEERVANVMELVAKAEEFERVSEDKNLGAFLEEIALVADIDNYAEDQDVVILMTVHSAKGLEFDTVFLTGFEEYVFPTSRSTFDPSEKSMEEERRLCYVAITRAKEQLYITNARSRRLFNETAYNPPSRFLKEIPEGLLEEAGKPEKLIALTNEPLYKKPAFSYSSLSAPKSGQPSYGVGDFVRQKKYGQGQVVDIKPAGADYEVTVEFDAGRKKFMAHLSNLEKL